MDSDQLEINVAFPELRPRRRLVQLGFLTAFSWIPQSPSRAESLSQQPLCVQHCKPVLDYVGLGKTRKLKGPEILNLIRGSSLSLFHEQGRKQPSVQMRQEFAVDGRWHRVDAEIVARGADGAWSIKNDKLCILSRTPYSGCHRVWIYIDRPDLILISDTESARYGAAALLYKIEKMI